MTFYAHTLKDHPPEDWEPLEDHLRAVAFLAGEFANAFGAEDWGTALGLWHDLGKYSAEFQHYIRPSHTASSEDAHELERSGRVDHSTAGAVHASSLGQLGRLLAYGVAGHHAGLPNNVGGESSLTGAWIETFHLSLIPGPQPVAPFTGAWIETAAHVSGRAEKGGREREDGKPKSSALIKSGPIEAKT